MWQYFYYVDSDLLLFLVHLLSLILCVLYVCFAFMLICVPLGFWCMQQLEQGMRLPKIGVTGTCVPLYGWWELNPGHLEEQLVLLTAETSPQSHDHVSRHCLLYLSMKEKNDMKGSRLIINLGHSWPESRAKWLMGDNGMYCVVLLFFFFTLYYNLKRKTNKKIPPGAKCCLDSIQPKRAPLHFWDNWSLEHMGTWFFIQQTAWRHVEIYDSNIWSVSWGKNFLCFLRIYGNVFLVGGNQRKYNF